jgi:hypothetical protein
MSEYDKELQSNTGEFDEARAPLESEARMKLEREAARDGGAEEREDERKPAR